MSDWTWRPTAYGLELHAHECVLHLSARPGYCDRGTVQLHCECFGYPINPSPVDFADGFPRYYSSAEVAMSEAVWLMERRKYKPATLRTIIGRWAEREEHDKRRAENVND